MDFRFSTITPSRWSSAARCRFAARSTTPASSSCRCRSIARPPTSAAPATVRTKSCRPPRTWSCGTKRCGPTCTAIGIFTLPEMELPFGEMEPLIDEIERVAYEVIGRDKFLVTLGGEHSITPPLVSAAARKYPNLSVLQIDAHADMRESYMGTRAQSRLRHAPAARIRSADPGRDPEPLDRRSRGAAEAEDDGVLRRLDAPGSRPGSTTWSPRSVPTSTSASTWTAWTRRSCRPPGTPEPGGLSWAEITRLLKRHRQGAAHRRRRHRRAEPDPRHGGAHLSLREADLQAAHLLLRRRSPHAPPGSLNLAERADPGRL